MPCSCGSDAGTNLIYACSGAANTGSLADQVMRALVRGQVGAGTCLAAVGADLSCFVESARNATRNIVLDGCKVACGKKVLERHGLHFRHFIMTDYDVEKGKTTITGNLIETVAERIGLRATDRTPRLRFSLSGARSFQRSRKLWPFRSEKFPEQILHHSCTKRSAMRGTLAGASHPIQLLV
jgi:uncharacterized metal-binding protein